MVKNFPLGLPVVHCRTGSLEINR
ncbi:hypothetical protein A1WG_03353, partial [Escherichia sp. KTE96]